MNESSTPRPGALAELFAVHSWCQGALAFTRDGTLCIPWDNSACALCLSGALMRCYRGREHETARARLLTAVRRRGCDSIEAFNDSPGRTFAEILDVINEAQI